MLIKIYDKCYRINPDFTASSRRIIHKLLKQIRVESKLRGLNNYYLTFVIMMYSISASILKDVNPEQLTEAIQKAEQKKP